MLVTTVRFNREICSTNSGVVFDLLELASAELGLHGSELILDMIGNLSNGEWDRQSTQTLMDAYAPRSRILRLGKEGND